MADLHIVRDHTLGLTRARKLAFQWAERVEQDFAMACIYAQGKSSDEVSFSRSGVKGMLQVSASRFELSAHLGLLVGAFKSVIEAEIVKHLDALLAAPAASTARSKKAAGSAQ